MEPPPIQYVRTRDGFDIAYTVAGHGIPFVFMPWPFSNMSRIWDTRFGRPMLEGLAARFKLIQYDSRGQGVSTRGLPEHHSLEDYETDLRTVVDHLSLDRFILYGGPTFSHVAARFAAGDAERIHALVLGDTVRRQDSSHSAYVDLARRDWDFFLHTITSSFSLHGAPVELPYWRESITQDDYLAMMRAGMGSDITQVLGSVRAPTLIINTGRLTADAPVGLGADEGQAMARLIPNSKLILMNAWASHWYSDGPEPPLAVLAIEDFVRDLGLITSEPMQPEQEATEEHSLSPREREVLRLIARGRSNQQIADELVLSVRTVERHITNLYAKIDAHGKAEATAFALRHGIA